MATLVKVKYVTKATGKPAQKDDKGNLIMRFRIDRSSVTAIFDCGHAEHVGSHSGRYVTFVAEDVCTLHFTKKEVFGLEELSLTSIPTPVFIKDTTNNCETEFYVTTDAETMQQAEIAPFASPSTVGPKVPPKSVVP